MDRGILPSIYTPQTRCWKRARRCRSTNRITRSKDPARYLAAMCAFYEDVVWLEVLLREESFVFFEIAEGYGGTRRTSQLQAAVG